MTEVGEYSENSLETCVFSALFYYIMFEAYNYILLQLNDTDYFGEVIRS